MAMKALKSLALASVLGVSLASGAANAADELTLQLKWVTQGQFAGYYVAKEKAWT
jgi:NitT/TauT family transport system substrate-binding protein